MIKAAHCRIYWAQGLQVPPATQGHQKSAHGEIDTSSHGVIHTEYDSSCYTCAYYFSFLIYEVAQEAVDFPLAFPRSGSIWWEAEKQLEKNVTTDP